MASVGHLAVGAAVGALYSRQTGAHPRVAILTFAALALAPDLDLLTGLFGVRPNIPVAHRGITHSVFFSLATALAVGAVVRGSSRRRFLAGFWVFVALASHGLLDAMCQLGNGPMLLWPLTHTQFESPWRPIPGVLLGEGHFLPRQVIRTLVVETLLFSPLIVYALISFRGGASPGSPFRR
jgi:inner membrane protein